MVNGERLQQPDSCSDHVYALMQSCWQRMPKDGPNASEVQTRLQDAVATEILEASNTESVVCLSAEPVMALLPCGHGCACEECGPSRRVFECVPCAEQMCKRPSAFSARPRRPEVKEVPLFAGHKLCLMAWCLLCQVPPPPARWPPARWPPVTVSQPRLAQSLLMPLPARRNGLQSQVLFAARSCPQAGRKALPRRRG